MPLLTPSVSARPTSSWTAPHASVPGGFATAFSPRVRSVSSPAKTESRMRFLKTISWRTSLKISPAECCRCAILPTTTTGFLSRTGRCGLQLKFSTDCPTRAEKKLPRAPKTDSAHSRNTSKNSRTERDFSKSSKAGCLSSGRTQTISRRT